MHQSETFEITEKPKIALSYSYRNLALTPVTRILLSIKLFARQEIELEIRSQSMIEISA